MNAKIYKHLVKQQLPKGLSVKYVEVVKDLLEQSYINIDLKGCVRAIDMHDISTLLIKLLTQRFKLSFHSGVTNEHDRIYLRFNALSDITSYRKAETGKSGVEINTPPTVSAEDTSDIVTSSSPSEDVLVKQQKKRKINSKVESRLVQSDDNVKIRNSIVPKINKSDSEIKEIDKIERNLKPYEQTKLCPGSKTGLGFKPIEFVKSKDDEIKKVEFVEAKSDKELMKLVKEKDIQNLEITITEPKFEDLQQEIKVVKTLLDSQKIKISALEVENSYLKDKEKDKEIELAKIDTGLTYYDISELETKINLRCKALLKEFPKYKLSVATIKHFEKWALKDQPMENILIEIFAGLTAGKVPSGDLYNMKFVASYMGFGTDIRLNIQLILALISPVFSNRK